LRFFLRWLPGMLYPHTWLKAQFLAMRGVVVTMFAMLRKAENLAFGMLYFPQHDVG